SLRFPLDTSLILAYTPRSQMNSLEGCVNRGVRRAKANAHSSGDELAFAMEECMRLAPGRTRGDSLLATFCFKPQEGRIDNNEASGFIQMGSHSGDRRASGCSSGRPRDGVKASGIWFRPTVHKKRPAAA